MESSSCFGREEIFKSWPCDLPVYKYYTENTARMECDPYLAHATLAALHSTHFFFSFRAAHIPCFLFCYYILKFTWLVQCHPL